jgi:phage baseplate assembly protein W
MAVRLRTGINPIDLNKNKAIGVAFPYDTPGVFRQSFSEKDAVKSNLINLILTEPGERVYEPNFGLGLKNKLFENNINVEELKLQIGDKINQFIPQVSLADVDAQLDQNLHTLLITISYKIMNTGESDAIEINFNQST